MTNLRDVISHCGGFIGNHPLLIDKSLKANDTAESGNAKETEMYKAKTATEEAYMTTPFLSVLNQAIYGVMLNKLHNNFRTGHGE